MFDSHALTLPHSHPTSASGASFASQLSSVARATRVGGRRGIGQALRGAWQPRFLQPDIATPSPEPPEIATEAAANEPPVPLRWWQSLLQLFGIVHFGPAITPANRLQEQPTDDYAAATDLAAAEVFRLPTAPGTDPAASFWDEHRTWPGDTVQVYEPAELAVVMPEPLRIGRSFLGAYRKGRRAAEDGLRAEECPYQPKPGKRGHSVNAFTRTFQRYWTEGLHDMLAGEPERYV